MLTAAQLIEQLCEVFRFQSKLRGFVKKKTGERTRDYGIVRHWWSKWNTYTVTFGGDTTTEDSPMDYSVWISDELEDAFGAAPEIKLTKAWVPEIYRKSKMKTRAVRGEVSGGRVKITYKRVGFAPEPVKQDRMFYEIEMTFGEEFAD